MKHPFSIVAHIELCKERTKPISTFFKRHLEKFP